jgi:transposase
MIPLPSGVRVWLATGHTDMRKGFASLSLQVQEVLRRDPLSGQLFCFRGRSGDLLKVIWHDGQGACLFTKRLERGRFLGRVQPTARWRSPPPSSAICCPGSTGVILRKPGVRPRLADGFCLQVTANVIPSSHERRC